MELEEKRAVIVAGIKELGEHDFFFPMTLSRSFFEGHSNVSGLHHALGIDLNDVTQALLTKIDKKSAWVGPGKSWVSVLSEFGFDKKQSHFIFENSVVFGSAESEKSFKQLTWLNFNSERTPDKAKDLSLVMGLVAGERRSVSPRVNLSRVNIGLYATPNSKRKGEIDSSFHELSTQEKKKINRNEKFREGTSRDDTSAELIAREVASAEDRVKVKMAADFSVLLDQAREEFDHRVSSLQLTHSNEIRALNSKYESRLSEFHEEAESRIMELERIHEEALKNLRDEVATSREAFKTSISIENGFDFQSALRRGKLLRKERVQLSTLLNGLIGITTASQIEIPGVRKGSSFLLGNQLYMKVTQRQKRRVGPTSKSTNQRRAAEMRAVYESGGGTTSAVASFMRMNREVSTEAAIEVGLKGAAKMSVEETLAAVSEANLNASQLMKINSALRRNGHSPFASIPKARGHEKERATRCTFYELIKANAGSKYEQKKCDASLIAGCAFEQVALDLDLSIENGRFIELPLRCLDPRLGTIVLLFSSDKGQGANKWTITLLNQTSSQSYRCWSILALLEAVHPTQKLHPNDSYENHARACSRVRLLGVLSSSAAIQAGGSFALIPKSTVPQVTFLICDVTPLT